MRFSEGWLREWVDLADVDRETLVHRLTMAGLEVDAVEPVGGEFSSVVVGRIEAVEPHPSADRLKICRVDAGAAAPLQVVCGAPNARPGLRAPLARVGARLPDGTEIGAARLRGVESAGMLCSAVELELGEDAGGLLELPPELEPGTDLRQALALDDVSIEIDLTPNRADCLGMIGLAREVAAVFGREPRSREWPEVAPAHDETREVELASPADCPVYLGRVVRGIDPTARSPRWLVERLRRAGIKAISPTVDVTNYVLLELGQPMHAFDHDRLEGRVVVRRAGAEERLELLTGEHASLDPRFLVIADGEGAVAVGGVMGGARSAVTGETRNVFLESAFFDPAVIVGRARDLGLHTDASHRFERGVDPGGQRRAMERATALLMEIAGGEPGPVVAAVAADHVPRRHPVRLRPGRVERLLGTTLEAAEIEAILGHLGMELEPAADGWAVTPPPRRFDIALEEDLIEEVARIHGYDRLPARAPEGAIPAVSIPERRYDLERARLVLVERGYSEAINYSFLAPEHLAPLGDEGFPLANPLSADLAVMRTSLLPALVLNLRYNLNRQQKRVRLFELGTVFPVRGGEVAEHRRVAAVACGSARPEHWGEDGRDVDFFDLKGDLEALLALTGDGDFHFDARPPAWLHPGQGARVRRGQRPVGWVGALHPAWLDGWDLDVPVFAFELDLDALGDSALPAARPLSRFPSIRRDLAIVVREEVEWAQIASIIEESAGNLLTELVVFDEYRGPGIEESHKSVALGLVLQSTERTLTDDEIDAVVAAATRGLESRVGARLRT